MREIRTSGSEGGGAGNLTGSPYPYQGAKNKNVSSSRRTHQTTLRRPVRFFDAWAKSSTRRPE